MKSKYLFLLIVLGSLFTSLSSCKKTLLFSKGNLNFSRDTIVFDTVFTTIGSTTKNFKIYNSSSRTIKIEEIELMGGENSPFRMNIDGDKADFIRDIELEGKDSLFGFIEVTLNVNNQTLPLVIEDSIRFRTNGVDQYIHLVVWGQDAYFHYKDLNSGTWPNDKPHVIYGYAAVDSAQTLNIQPNTQIYMHKNAILYVYKGTLNINGSLGQEVKIQGDRLEADYDDISGQFYGIYFQEARPSTINYAIMKNGISGVHLYSRDDAFSGYTLTMTNTTISNFARYGTFIYSGAKVKAENCVISKNGNHALLVLAGGDFFFNHCHLVGYGDSESATPAVGISNFYNDTYAGVQYIGSINEGKIYNSVIYGNQETEIVVNKLEEAGIVLNFDIRDCVIKSTSIPTDTYYNNIRWNENPSFVDVTEGDFTFWSTSAMNNTANPLYSLPFDIRGNARSITTPDIGAYEY